MAGDKQCTKCNKTYPATIEYFHKNSNCAHGLNSRCKTCSSRATKFSEPLVNLEGELWVSIQGYEGLYEISNMGRVRSMVKRGNSWKGRIMKLTVAGRGYQYIGLRKHNIPTTYTLHSLVITSFISARPDGMVVNHIDGDKTNNKLTNLEWVTPKENSKHALEILNRSCGNPNKKLNAFEVAEIKERYFSGFRSPKYLGEEYGVSATTIQKIVNFKTWKDT